MHPQLLLRPDLGKRPYRLHCRLRIEPFPTKDRLEREKVKVAEWFVADMAKEGWEYVSKFGFTLNPKPYMAVTPRSLSPVPRRLTAKEMLPAVMQGARFLGGPSDGVQIVEPLDATEWWEFDISAVFLRNTIVFEIPEQHEEEEELKH